MDEKLKSTLDKVVKLTRQNPEFGQELRKALEIKPSANVALSSDVSNDVIAIREALEIRANKSVSYSFIAEQRLKDQLIVDNLRMENAALNLKDDEKERFYSFCVNAFYQIENIVNYFFYKSYPNFDLLAKVIENLTSTEREEFRFKRKCRDKTVSDIPIAHKLNAICTLLFPGDNIKLLLSNLRQVRNEGEHRCMVIQEEKDENNNLYRFFKYNTFNTVRVALIKLINTIKENVGKVVEEKQVTIISVLPSCCFVRCDDKTLQLPNDMLSKLSGKIVGDTLHVILSHGKIWAFA